MHVKQEYFQGEVHILMTYSFDYAFPHSAQRNVASVIISLTREYTGPEWCVGSSVI